MGTVNKFIEIKTIKFNNFSTEVQLLGTVIQDKLSFESIVKIESNLMNLLINFLQRNNPDEDIVGKMVSEYLPEDEIHYTIALEGLQTTIPMDDFFAADRYVQVRA